MLCLEEYSIFKFEVIKVTCIGIFAIRTVQIACRILTNEWMGMKYKVSLIARFWSDSKIEAKRTGKTAQATPNIRWMLRATSSDHFLSISIDKSVLPFSFHEIKHCGIGPKAVFVHLHVIKRLEHWRLLDLPGWMVKILNCAHKTWKCSNGNFNRFLYSFRTAAAFKHPNRDWHLPASRSSSSNVVDSERPTTLQSSPQSLTWVPGLWCWY